MNNCTILAFPGFKIEALAAGGMPCLLLHPHHGDGSFVNFTVGNAADGKRTVLALAVSLRKECFLCSCCSRFAASIAITASTYSARFRHLSASDFLGSRKAPPPPTPRLTTALHKFPHSGYT
jgi:hypothetical protein